MYYLYENPTQDWRVDYYITTDTGYPRGENSWPVVRRSEDLVYLIDVMQLLVNASKDDGAVGRVGYTVKGDHPDILKSKRETLKVKR